MPISIFVFSTGFTLYFGYSLEAVNFLHQKMRKKYGHFVSPVWSEPLNPEDLPMTDISRFI